MGEMALPLKMKWAFKELDNIRKENYSWIPSSGQGDVQANQRIIIDLPQNSLVDLTTFQMAYTGESCHNGAADTAADNTVQTWFFPRNSSSIIQNLEVRINNQTIFNVPEYNMVWNKLYDYTCGQDSLARRKAGGENSDPSSKTFIDTDGIIRSRRGYAFGDIRNNTARDKDTYVIRSWLGPFSSASTQVIDTTLLGTVTIVITLAPATVLMSGQYSTDAVAAVVAGTSETGRAIAALGRRSAGGGQGALAADVFNYRLSNIVLSVDRYHMDANFYNAQANVLSSGSVYKLWYPNYTVLSSNSVLASNKTSVHRFNISTRSLDYVMGTFKIVGYDTPGPPIISKISTDNTKGFYGSNDATFESQVKNGLPVLFNNSKYLLNNGDSIVSTKWKIGTHEYRTKTNQENFDGLLNHFNIQQNVDGGMYPGIASLNHFITQFYADLISLNVSGEGSDIFTASGINTNQGPINIEWYVNANALTGATEFTPAAGNCLPYLIAGYSSHIEIRGGRQISLVS